MPASLVARRITCPFELLEATADLGMLMSGPTSIRWEDSLMAYQDFHSRWDEHLETQRAIFKRYRPDLVLVDIPYLPVVAAEEAGIPAVAFSSLNWVDIIEANQDIARQMRPELAVMRKAYQMAEYFIRCEPAMPMSWLTNRRPVGPVMVVGRDIRQQLTADLGIDPGQKLVLVSLGGIPLHTELDRWPEIPGVQWLLPDSQAETRPDVHVWQDDRYSFVDLIASVDLVITKPGYGMFTEIAACGVPTLNIARPDWGETEVLEQWLEQQVALLTIPLQQLLQGDIDEEIRRLLVAPRGRPVAPSGIAQAVELLAPWLQ